MKKIILLLLVIFSICSCEQEVKDFGIVQKVELYNRKFSNGYKTKYKITVSEDFSAMWIKAVVYTNDLYTIGDTIVVTNKNNLKYKNHEQRN